MLDFCDISVLAFFSSQFPTSGDDAVFPSFTTAYSPPAFSRQALARAMQQENVGIPGLTVFRTDTQVEEGRNNRPMAAVGQNFGDKTPRDMVTLVQGIPIRAEYTLLAWADNQQDMNTIDRILHFCDVYQTVSTEIQGWDFEFPINRLSSGYETFGNDKTGLINWFCTEKKYEVNTDWLRTSAVKQIQTISIDFKRILNGNVIDPVDIESIIVQPPS